MAATSSDFQAVLRNMEDAFLQTLSSALAEKGVAFSVEEMREAIKKAPVAGPAPTPVAVTAAAPGATRTPSPKQKCGYIGQRGGTCKKGALANCYTCADHQSQEAAARQRAGVSSTASMPPVRTPMPLPTMPAPRTPPAPKWNPADDGWLEKADDPSYRAHKESGLVYHDVAGDVKACGILLDGKIQALTPQLIAQLQAGGQQVEGVSA